MGRFTRFAVFTCVAALAAFSSFAVKPASAGETTYLKTITVKWVEAGQLQSTAKDTMFVTDEADTARSQLISLDGIDWSATLAQAKNTFLMNAAGTNPDSSGPIVVATVDFVATKANNGVADTIYFNPEQAAIQSVVSNSCASCKPDTMFAFNPLGVSSGHGNGTTDALSSGFATVRGTNSANQYNQNIFHGYLLANPNRRGKNDMWGVQRFRLVTSGDVGGSSPKLSGVMCFITYLAKR